MLREFRCSRARARANLEKEKNWLFIKFFDLHVNKSACVFRSGSGGYALESLESCAYIASYATLGGRGRGL